MEWSASKLDKDQSYDLAIFSLLNRNSQAILTPPRLLYENLWLATYLRPFISDPNKYLIKSLPFVAFDQESGQALLKLFKPLIERLELGPYLCEDHLAAKAAWDLKLQSASSLGLYWSTKDLRPEDSNELSLLLYLSSELAGAQTAARWVLFGEAFRKLKSDLAFALLGLREGKLISFFEVHARLLEHTNAMPVVQRANWTTRLALIFTNPSLYSRYPGADGHSILMNLVEMFNFLIFQFPIFILPRQIMRRILINMQTLVQTYHESEIKSINFMEMIPLKSIAELEELYSTSPLFFLPSLQKLDRWIFQLSSDGPLRNLPPGPCDIKCLVGFWGEYRSLSSSLRYRNDLPKTIMIVPSTGPYHIVTTMLSLLEISTRLLLEEVPNFIVFDDGSVEISNFIAMSITLRRAVARVIAANIVFRGTLGFPFTKDTLRTLFLEKGIHNSLPIYEIKALLQSTSLLDHVDINTFFSERLLMHIERRVPIERSNECRNTLWTCAIAWSVSISIFLILCFIVSNIKYD